MRALPLMAGCLTFWVAISGAFAAQKAAVCPVDASGVAAAQKAAATLLFSLAKAYAHLQNDFGRNILISRKAEVETTLGYRTIGDVWGEYLTQAGFPKFDERQRCVQLLAPYNLSDTASTILILMPADFDSVEDLMAQLKRIAKRAAATK